jgi:hypothetical protein
LLPSQSRFRDVPQISRDKFDRLLRATTEFTLCVLDSYGLRDHWPARPTLTPQIRFLYIGSRFCSTLPSDPASRRRPCASLSLHLYQDVKRTCTSQLSNMLGVPKKKHGACAPCFSILAATKNSRSLRSLKCRIRVRASRAGAVVANNTGLVGAERTLAALANDGRERRRCIGNHRQSAYTYGCEAVAAFLASD